MSQALSIVPARIGAFEETVGFVINYFALCRRERRPGRKRLDLARSALMPVLRLMSSPK
jgi:hypothetical protein